MDLLMVLFGTAVFPWLGLGFLFWMARLEDNLPAAARRAERKPDPPPILVIPVRRVVAEPTTTRVPAQRSEVSLSTAASLGGSTNL